MDTNLFKCDMCNKTFTFKTNLTRHIYSHTPTLSPPTCYKCDKTFSRSDSLKNHKKKCDLKKATLDENRLEPDMIEETHVYDEMMGHGLRTTNPFINFYWGIQN